MKKSIFGLSVALLTFLTLGLHVWACPIPKASVLKTTVCVGDVSVVTPGYDLGSCPPVGDPWISAMSLNTAGLTPAAAGTTDKNAGTVTWTSPGYAWLEVTVSINYQCEGGKIEPNTRTTNFYFTVIKVDSVDVHSSDTDSHKIASVLANGKDHFVCVKDPGDIVLNATVLPNNPAVYDQLTWEADGATIAFPAVGTDKRTARLSSATSKKIPVRIKVGGSTCWEGVVWVVWSSTQASGGNKIINIGQTSGGIRFDNYEFFHTISPNTIITDSDCPNLTGPNQSNVPNVPSSETDVPNAGDDLSGGATLKWDDSRRSRRKIINPDAVDFSDSWYGGTWDNDPSALLI